MKSEKERISLSLCNIWNSFSCWADDKTRGLCRGSVLFILITVLFVTTEKRDGAALRQFLHPVTGARGASSELITDGIRGWVQNLQLCYEHKKYASISTENLQERNRCLCPFSKFPSGLCNNLEFFFYLFPSCTFFLWRQESESKFIHFNWCCSLNIYWWWEPTGSACGSSLSADSVLLWDWGWSIVAVFKSMPTLLVWLGCWVVHRLRRQRKWFLL